MGGERWVLGLRTGLEFGHVESQDPRLMDMLVTVYSNIPKRNRMRQSKTRTEHPLVRRHIPHIPDLDLRVFRSDLIPQTTGHLMTDLDLLFFVVVAFSGEAMDVDHGQFGCCVRGEECFVAAVESDECVEEGGGRGGEVHHVVVEGFGLREGLRGR